jgi:hypothetical protein
MHGQSFFNFGHNMEYIANLSVMRGNLNLVEFFLHGPFV